MGTSGEKSNPVANAAIMPTVSIFSCSARVLPPRRNNAHRDAKKHSGCFREEVDVNAGPDIIESHDAMVNPGFNVADLGKGAVWARKQEIQC